MKIPFNITYNSKNIEQGRYFNSKHYSSIPYNLYIATNNYHQSLEIEFSSKVLKERYPELINRDTIRQCLSNINNLDICTLDVDGIINHGWVIGADITADVDLMLTDRVLNALNQNVGNYRRFQWTHYDGKGITFTKNTIYDKEEIKVYNKYKELLSHSRKFIDSLENRNDIMDYFYGKTRFEITLKGEKQIRERLGVGTGIKDFFNAIDSAVREQFDRVFNASIPILDTTQCNGYEEWAMAHLLDSYNGDLRQIEQSLRQESVYNSRNGLSERMKKFQSVKARTKRKENEIVRSVRSLL
ncbi:MAG: hypothetical protein J6U95_00740 [Alistipes sp.]|jgi:hypothetical protein|nr:hypothetical protein [Alistipes sp.]